MRETPQGKKRLTSEKVANRVKWVKALLSGNYRQGDGQLRSTEFDYDDDDDDADDDDKAKSFAVWCCLGVAGHCLNPSMKCVQEESTAAYLPAKWAFEHLGITGGEETDDSDQEEAANWNDSKCFNFEEIADRVALATEKAQHFFEVTNAPELKYANSGDYAREWLSRNT